MANGKKGFLLYADYLTIFKNLEKKDPGGAGRLIIHILEYVNDLDPEPPNVITDIAFEPIKLQLMRDLEAWDDKVLQCSDAGKKSAAARKAAKERQAKREATPVNERPERSTVLTVNESANAIENDNDIKHFVAKSDLEFEVFRKKFPGIKRGLKWELANFKAKHKNYKDIVPLLMPALLKEISWRAGRRHADFTPQWKNLKTWLNQSCWSQELPGNGLVTVGKAATAQAPPVIRFPDTYDAAYENRLPADRKSEYWAHLVSKGWSCYGNGHAKHDGRDGVIWVKE